MIITVRTDVAYDLERGTLEDVLGEIMDTYNLYGVEVLQESGPGGGWPHVEWEGEEADVKQMLFACFNPGDTWDDLMETYGLSP